MGIGLIKGNSSVFINEETTEGIYVAPASANDALEVLADGIGFEYTRDEIERNTLSSTIEVEASRVGLPQVKGTIPTEYKASSLVGTAPRNDVLFKSLLGGKHTLATQVTSLTGHTTTKIYLDTPDLALFKKGAIVKVLEAGAHAVRPIKAIGVDHIELAVALASVPSDGVVIEKATTYYHKEGAKTFSATHYLGGKVAEKVAGLRALSCSLDSWETAKTPSLSFAVEGLSLLREVATPAFTPDFSTDALPPVLLGACIYVNGVKVPYSKFSMTLENTKSELLSVCSPQGKLGSRFTEFKVTGSINPYMEDDDTDRFNLFNLNEDVSIFGYAYTPTAVTGEFKEAVCFYLPQVKITSMPTADEDQVLTDDIQFKAYRKEGGDTIFLSFI